MRAIIPSPFRVKSLAGIGAERKREGERDRQRRQFGSNREEGNEWSRCLTRVVVALLAFKENDTLAARRGIICPVPSLRLDRLELPPPILVHAAIRIIRAFYVFRIAEFCGLLSMVMVQVWEYRYCARMESGGDGINILWWFLFFFFFFIHWKIKGNAKIRN